MFSVSSITFIYLIPRKTFIWYEVFLSQNFLDFICLLFYLPAAIFRDHSNIIVVCSFCHAFCTICFHWMKPWDDPFWAHYSLTSPHLSQHTETGSPPARPLGWVRELTNVSWTGTLQTPPKIWSGPITLRFSQFCLCHMHYQELRLLICTSASPRK